MAAGEQRRAGAAADSSTWRDSIEAVPQTSASIVGVVGWSADIRNDRRVVRRLIERAVRAVQPRSQLLVDDRIVEQVEVGAVPDVGEPVDGELDPPGGVGPAGAVRADVLDQQVVRPTPSGLAESVADTIE